MCNTTPPFPKNISNEACIANCTRAHIYRPVRLSYKPYFFSQRTIFFSHNKSANNTFSHGLSVKRRCIRLAWARGMLGRRRAVGRPPTYTETAMPARAAASGVAARGAGSPPSSLLSGQQWPIRSIIGRQRAAGSIGSMSATTRSQIFSPDRSWRTTPILRYAQKNLLLFVCTSATCNVRV